MPSRAPIKFSTALTLIIFLVSSCARSPRCQGADVNKGIIVASVSIPADPRNNAQEKFVVTDKSSYKLLFPDSALLPDIDFSVHTLLGLYAGGGCSVKFVRNVKKIEKEKKYSYEVKVRECGNCKKYSYSYNWVTVPRLADGWTVSMAVK